MWQVILRTKVTPRQVGDCLEAFKIVRTIEGGSNIDNYIDRIGYAALAAEAEGIKIDEESGPSF